MKFENNYPEFDKASYEQWLELTKSTIKVPTEKLISGTYEGIDIHPIYFPNGKKLELPAQEKAFLVDKEYVKNFKSIIDTSVLHNSGANAIQELAFALDLLTEKEEALSEILFVFAINSEFFVQIAKLRAFRMLMHSLFDVDTKINILCTNSLVNKSELDRHNNLLRQSSEVMSAILGGATAIQVDPYDFSDSEHSTRISDNIYSIFSDESKIADVDDPSSGSYFIDDLTKKIFSSTIDLFKILQEKARDEKIMILTETVRNVATLRLEDINTRKLKMTGVNIYHNQMDKVPENIEHGQGLRLADAFELYQRKSRENSPKVFVACFNQRKVIGARMDFIEDLLQTGGFNIEFSDVFENLEEAVNTSELVDADTIVLCATDDTYKEIVPSFIDGIKKNASHKMLVLAGLPEDSNRYEELGIDLFLHVKSNIFNDLNKIWDHNENED